MHWHTALVSLTLFPSRGNDPLSPSVDLTLVQAVGIITNMREGAATEIITDRQEIGEGRFAEIAIWEVPKPKAPSTHLYKYRLAFIVNDVCVIRYDNETGKGDHRHRGGKEAP